MPNEDAAQASTMSLPGRSIGFPARTEMIGQSGLLHGGAIAGMLAAAAEQMVAAHVGNIQGAVEITAITSNLEYLRPGYAEETIVTAAITKAGRRIVQVTGEARQAGTKLIARADFAYLLTRI